MDCKSKISSEIHAKRSLLDHLVLTIGAEPELGFAEYKAVALLTETLAEAGFTIEQGVGKLPTAFRATLGQGKPNIALLCEYDALPGLGHACGHNLIGTASVGAALALAPLIEDLGGTLTVIGCPGEETGGGKVILVEEGVFNQIDAALMFHPSDQNVLMSPTNALDAYEFIFTGQAAHAASSPELGVNALDAVILLFNGINALREHLPAEVRIHGIISEGGVAPNIVPDLAKARFYLRAPHRDLLDTTTAKVKKIAQGAAQMTGAQVTWEQFELPNDNLIPNETMSLAFGANLQKLGVTEIEEFAPTSGSSDMGNVSRVVPAIHPYLKLDENLVAHTKEFAQASVGPKSGEVVRLAAQALAYTIVDLLTTPDLLQAAKKEHTQC